MKNKKLLTVLSLVIVLIFALVITNYSSLARVYHAITLFNEDVIVRNFSHMDSMFETIEVKQPDSIYTFGRSEQDFPTHYNYLGETRSIEEFLNRTRTTALLVLKDNDIVFEEYYLDTRAEDRRITWSVSKSFLSALFGIAIEEGSITSLQDPVTKYVPELIGSGYDGVSIKNVLQMSSGVRFDEDYGSFNSDINRFGRLMALGGSFDEFAASLVNERQPGTFLNYVSLDTHVLGMVLRNATGRAFVDYFNDKLWSQIGAEDSALFMIDQNGEPMVLGGMNIRTRDFARFGKLYRDGGVLNGKQIVPAQWIIDSTTPDAPHLIPGPRDTSAHSLGYGFQWWIPENADSEFMAIGIYDQFIYINQKAGVVIVKNSANIDFMENAFEATTETVEVFRSIVTSLQRK
jgi:CubicO group peptidase (beta-lactamase class C family)